MEESRLNSGMRIGGRSASGNSHRLPINGTRLTATKRLAARLTHIVMAISLNMTPAIPGTKSMGTNTLIVVRVDATIAISISLGPFTAASIGICPSSMNRTVFSSTTIELSTSIPTASARPARLMMFRFRSSRYMAKNAKSMLSGMLSVTIILARIFLRNTSRMIAAMIKARTAVFARFPMDRSMKPACSKITLN